MGQNGLICIVVFSAVQLAYVRCATPDCSSYSTEANTCQPDLLPFCLTNGSVIYGSCDFADAVCRDGQQEASAPECCTPSGCPVNCSGYSTGDRPCHHDLIPYCLTNGTIIFGSCGYTEAVCRDGQQQATDPECCTPNGCPVNCSSYSTGDRPCHHDLIPYCLTNGTIIFGSCGFTEAVCRDGQQQATDPACCTPSSCPVDCSGYSTGDRPCHHDLIPYCLTNGTTIFGSCGYTEAVCRDGQKQATDPECCTLRGCPVDCSSYSTGDRPCHHDLIPYCLTNGTTIFGSCGFTEAVCRDGQQQATDPECCTPNGCPVDCSGYSTGDRPCHHDLIPYCLTNGTIIFGSCGYTEAVCRDGQQQATDPECCTPNGCPVDCSGYSTGDRPCHHDLIPYCLTNGTTIFGSCGLTEAVCRDGQQQATDPECCTPNGCPVDCSGYSTGDRPCHHDLIPYCLTNGTTIFGSCGLTEAVCRDGQQQATAPECCTPSGCPVDCSGYSTGDRPCHHDLIPYCLTNGTTIFGSCGYTEAVCRDGQQQATAPECCTPSGCPVDCSGYSTGDRPCHHDLIPYCLTNGTIIFGSCGYTEAVCRDGQREAVAPECCTASGCPDPDDTDDDGNQANGAPSASGVQIVLLRGTAVTLTAASLLML